MLPGFVDQLKRSSEELQPDKTDRVFHVAFGQADMEFAVWSTQWVPPFFFWNWKEHMQSEQEILLPTIALKGKPGNLLVLGGTNWLRDI